MTMPTFYTDFVLNLTQSQALIYDTVLGTMFILLGMSIVLWCIVKSTEVGTLKQETLFCVKIVSIVVLTFSFVFLTTSTSMRQYSIVNSKEYIFSGESLLALTVSPPKEISKDVVIRNDQETQLVGKVECGQLSLKNCFNKIMEAKPQAGNSASVIDVSSN